MPNNILSIDEAAERERARQEAEHEADMEADYEEEMRAREADEEEILRG